MKSRLTLAAGLCAALASSAQAEVAINENLALDGYVILAGTVTDPDGGPSTETLADSGASNLDAARIALLANYGDLSGKVSLFYVPGRAGTEAGVLDAYATYSAGAVSITGGKFLSYLGYEAFEPVNMAQLTYGFASGIPGFATGAKIDYAGESFSLGLSIQDSLDMEPGTFFQGDGDFGDGLGYTAAASFTGIEKLTVFVGVGYDDDEFSVNDYVFNIWASYDVSDTITVAGEMSYEDNASTSYIGLLKYTFSENVSSIFRWSAQETDATGEWATKLTVAPTYVINENFSVRAEVTYDDQPKTTFYGAQGIFKF